MIPHSAQKSQHIVTMLEKASLGGGLFAVDIGRKCLRRTRRSGRKMASMWEIGIRKTADHR